jgi:hypothetical protein
MSLNLKKYFQIIISTMLLQVIGCNSSSNDKQDELTETLPGDFSSIRAIIVLQGIPEILETKDVSGSEVVFISVTFDINNDSIFSGGDISLRISKNYDAQTNEASLKSSLLQFNDPSERIGHNLLAEIEYSIQGNEIVFELQKEQSSELDKLSSMTQLNVTVSYGPNSSNKSSDLLPEANTYTQVQNNSLIEDPIGDFQGNLGIIDISEFRLELL